MIHYIQKHYNSKFIIAKSFCGIDWDKCNDSTDKFEYVTCKKCLKAFKYYNVVLQNVNTLELINRTVLIDNDQNTKVLKAIDIKFLIGLNKCKSYVFKSIVRTEKTNIDTFINNLINDM